MALDKAEERLKIQADLGGGYITNAAKLILADVPQFHGQQAVDTLIKN